jgi:glycosyltransferase involved in cell wall biosynthesis
MARKSKLPILYLMGSLFLFIISKINKMAIERADYLICVSKFQKDRVVEHGIRNKNIVSINDITLIEEKIEPLDISINFKETKVIVFAGRIEFKKGLDTLIEAFSEVIKEVESKLVLIGNFENPYGDTLKLKIINLGLQDSVIFTGKIRNEQVLHIFKKSKVVVVPSLWPEPQGRTVMESLYMGTPVVATKSGGMPELMEKTDGVIVESNNPKEMSKAIISILKLSKSKSISPKKELREDFILEEHIRIYRDII